MVETIPGFLRGTSVATLAKVTFGEGLLGHDIKGLTRNSQFCGRAVTALCPYADNGALHMAIAAAGSEDVIVAHTSGPTMIGMWGGISSVASRLRGISALVLDGYITDIDEISEAGFCVFARGLSAYPPAKKTRGQVNIPVLIEGVMIHPGDIVVGDADGVIVLKQEDLPAIEREYAARNAKESGMIVSIKAGALTADLFGIK